MQSYQHSAMYLILYPSSYPFVSPHVSLNIFYISLFFLYTLLFLLSTLGSFKILVTY